MTKKHMIAALSLAFALASGLGFATAKERTPTEFYTGHTHDENGGTHDAPQHSGGLDRDGCHNASVPYHCHR